MSKIGFQENGPFPPGTATPGGEDCFCTASRSMSGSIITKKKDPTWFRIFLRIIICVECKKAKERYANQPMSINGLGTETIFFHAFKQTPCLDQPCYCNPHGMACCGSVTKMINSHGGDKREPMPQWAQDMIAIPPAATVAGVLLTQMLFDEVAASIVKQEQEGNIGFGPYERDGMPKCSSLKKRTDCCPPKT